MIHPAAYTVRRASTDADGEALVALYDEVFSPEPVAAMVRVMYHHLPGQERRNWMMAVPAGSDEPAAAVTIIPWQCELAGIPLKVAEQGIVGTRPAHRNRGLMRLLNAEFDRELAGGGYDLAVIQGIPGFYHRFGYRYAVPMENHVNLPPEACGTVPEGYAFRRAGLDDIPALMEDDAAYRHEYFLSVHRTRAEWEYLLTRSLRTDYGSEFVIMTCPDGRRFTCRVPFKGFGRGMQVSEISAGITGEAARALFAFLAAKLPERGKPFIRLNLPGTSVAVKTAVGMGAEPSRPYAWQVKIPDPARLLLKMKPVFDRRLRNGEFSAFSGTFRLDGYTSAIDMVITDGRLADVAAGTETACPLSLSIPPDCLAALVLGHRTWQQLQQLRPDVFPGALYTDPLPRPSDDAAAKLADALFPPEQSWLYERY